MIQFLAKLIAGPYKRRVNKLERRIGYRLEFKNIPLAWINGWMIFDISHAWQKHNINAIGVDYFTLGSLVNNLSSRFLRSEKQYQSWLGAYLVKFEEHRKFTLQDHFNLAIVDQEDWLGDFGDPKPFIEMLAEHVKDSEDMVLGQYKGRLYEFSGGPSHSDVGPNSNSSYSRFLMAIMAEVMNFSNPKLKLRGENFIPKDLSANYETVILKGYVAIIELEPDTHLVLYGNGCVVDNKDYYMDLKNDILTAFESVNIVKLK